MTELFLLGVGLVAFMAVWKFVVRKTAIDHYRDRLFDLRSEMRDFYISTGYGLHHPTYPELRTLLNNQIRFLDETSFTRLVICELEMDQNVELRDSIREDIERRFATESEELAAFIKKVRQRAYHHTSGYVLHSSIVFCSGVYLMLPVFLFCVLAHHSFRISKTMISEALLKMPKKAVSMDVIESFSEFQTA